MTLVQQISASPFFIFPTVKDGIIPFHRFLCTNQPYHKTPVSHHSRRKPGVSLISFYTIDNTCTIYSLLLCLIKDFLIQSFILMCNDCCTYSITCDINSCSCHIKDTVNTHDQTDCLNRKSDRVKYHCQCN
jgi:hypothetical protein